MNGVPIPEKVKEIIADQMGIEGVPINEDATLQDIGMDDLDRVELLEALNDQLDIDLPDAACLNARLTVAELICAVEAEELKK